MKLVKDFIKSKNFGFYVSLVVIVLSVVSAAYYMANYADTKYYMLALPIVVFIGAGLAFATIFTKKTTKILPYVIGLVALTGLLLFVQSIYLYVTEVFVGIDEQEYSKEFLTSVGLFGATFVIAFINCFLPQVRKEKKTEETQTVEVEAHE